MSSVFYCMVSYVYSHTLHYTPGRGVCRVSECHLYSSVYYRPCIRTPYTPAYPVAELGQGVRRRIVSAGR